jgi:hypothetical protein
VSHSILAQHGNRNNTVDDGGSAENVSLQKRETRAATADTAIRTIPAATYFASNTTTPSHARRTSNAASK